MTERELQDAVVTMARAFGWTVAHFRPARTKDGWRTPVGYDGQGFPDLVMVRDDRLMFVELKSARGKLSEPQKRWGELLGGAGADWRLWSLHEWNTGQVERVLAPVGVVWAA